MLGIDGLLVFRPACILDRFEVETGEDEMICGTVGMFGWKLPCIGGRLTRCSDRAPPFRGGVLTTSPAQSGE